MDNSLSYADTIEEDNFEEGLTSLLIEAGIDAKNIHTSMAQLSTSLAEPIVIQSEDFAQLSP